LSTSSAGSPAGKRYPLYSIAVLALVGALLSHFFWQEFRAP